MNGFRATASQTNKRTNERESLGLQRLRREKMWSEDMNLKNPYIFKKLTIQTEKLLKMYIILKS